MTNNKVTENNRNKPHRSGFTLIEVMIVLFILVMLGGMAVVSFTGTQAKAQRQGAFSYIKSIEGAVDQYTLAIGHPPTSDQGLAALISCPSEVSEGKWGGPYLKSNAKPTDPWGNMYQYACPGKNGNYDIWSYGPDMLDGTEDDIGNWMNEI